MKVDARAALSTLVTALERHLEAAAARRGENDPTVVAAYRDVADAFDAYDEALMESYGEVTPLEVYAGDEDDFDDEDDDLDEFEDDDDLDDEDDQDDQDDDEQDEDRADVVPGGTPRP